MPIPFLLFLVGCFVTGVIAGWLVVCFFKVGKVAKIMAWLFAVAVYALSGWCFDFVYRNHKTCDPMSDTGSSFGVMATIALGSMACAFATGFAITVSLGKKRKRSHSAARLPQD